MRDELTSQVPCLFRLTLDCTAGSLPLRGNGMLRFTLAAVATLALVAPAAAARVSAPSLR